MGNRSTMGVIKNDTDAKAAFLAIAGANARHNNSTMNHVNLKLALQNAGYPNIESFELPEAILKDRVRAFHEKLGNASVAVQDPTSATYNPEAMTMATRKVAGVPLIVRGVMTLAQAGIKKCVLLIAKTQRQEIERFLTRYKDTPKVKIIQYEEPYGVGPDIIAEIGSQIADRCLLINANLIFEKELAEHVRDQRMEYFGPNTYQKLQYIERHRMYRKSNTD